MRLGDLTTLRELLAGRDAEGDLIIGETYACALKKAAGFSGTRWFDVEAVVAWLKKNPQWKSTDVYRHKQPTQPRQCSPKGLSAATAGKSRERS